MGEQSGGAVGAAVVDGAGRVMSAPVVLIATLLATLVLSLPADPAAGAVLAAHERAVASWTPGAGALPALLWVAAGSGRPRAIFTASFVLTWLLVWPFLTGGILDRLARRRATRGAGFFAACGAHFPALLRVSIAELTVYAGILSAVSALSTPGMLTRGTAALAVVAAHAVATYARVRIAVEDRRAAMGALLASVRFLGRNPAAALIPAGTLAVLAALVGAEALRPSSGWNATVVLTFLGGELLVAVELAVSLALAASATALFQGRLAHASYTAAPPRLWPDSPAAEAIANLEPVSKA